MDRVIRVLMSKPGADGHWRGSVTVSSAMKDAGMEVIFGGFQSIPEIVETAIQEDVDVIGVSNHSAAHVPMNQEILNLLKKKNAANILVVAGGTILKDDKVQLEKMGVGACFTSGTDTKDIVNYIRKNVPKKTD